MANDDVRPSDWRQAVTRARLPRSALVYALWLVERPIPRRPGLYRGGQGDAASQLDVPERTVQRAERRLRESGLVVRVERGVKGRRNSVFRLAIPAVQPARSGGLNAAANPPSFSGLNLAPNPPEMSPSNDLPTDTTGPHRDHSGTAAVPPPSEPTAKALNAVAEKRDRRASVLSGKSGHLSINRATNTTTAERPTLSEPAPAGTAHGLHPPANTMETWNPRCTVCDRPRLYAPASIARGICASCWQAA